MCDGLRANKSRVFRLIIAGNGREMKRERRNEDFETTRLRRSCRPELDNAHLTFHRYSGTSALVATQVSALSSREARIAAGEALYREKKYGIRVAGKQIESRSSANVSLPRSQRRRNSIS